MIDAFFSALGILFVLILVCQIFSGDEEMRKKRDAEDARHKPTEDR